MTAPRGAAIAAAYGSAISVERNGGKRLRQDDAAILSGLSTRRYTALERGTAENLSLDLIENVASKRAEITICARIHNLILSGSTQTYSALGSLTL
jgi:hypothetical protein